MPKKFFFYTEFHLFVVVEWFFRFEREDGNAKKLVHELYVYLYQFVEYQYYAQMSACQWLLLKVISEWG